MNDLSPDFDALFGSLKKPPRELTPEEKFREEMRKLALQYPPSNKSKS